MSPGILAGAVTAFAAGLGEFGAVITFASNIPGETQTLPLAIYSATQMPGGEAMAARLAAISFTLAVAGLLAAEYLARRMALPAGARADAGRRAAAPLRPDGFALRRRLRHAGDRA